MKPPNESRGVVDGTHDFNSYSSKTLFEELGRINLRIHVLRNDEIVISHDYSMARIVLLEAHRDELLAELARREGK